jgi:catechol-2,3-dioxygenase
MIKKFAGASIWSEDLHNLLPFYRDVLGLKVVHESTGFVVLESVLKVMLRRF